MFSDKFDLNQEIKYKIVSIEGETFKRGTITKSIGISSILKGSFVPELLQKKNIEQKKIVKK